MKDSLVYWFLLSFVVMFLTTATLSQSTANPSQGSPIYVPVKYRQKVVNLPCDIRGDSALVLRWLKDDKVIDEDDDKDHYEIEEDDEKHQQTLVISNPTPKELGNYTCQLFNKKNLTWVENMSVNFNVMSDLTIKMDEASTFIEGEELKLKCIVTSSSKPHKIVWKFENTTYESSKDRVTLMTDEEKDIPNSIFHIANAVMDDRGLYTCMAYATAASNATVATTYVRIKDKFAALWPFLGICAEVFVLCTIILIYEKKRNKAEMDESDTDQSPDQKNATDQGKESVRQRK